MTPDQKVEPKPTPTVTYGQLLRFFLPLGITPFMIALSHSISNGAIARMPSPEANLAVWAVIQAFTNALKSPIHTGRHLVVSLVDDVPSYQRVMRFVGGLGALAAAVLAVIGMSPLGEWMLRHVIGLTEEKEVALALSCMLLIFLLPPVETIRNIGQGLAIRVRGSAVMPIALVLRLLIILLFLWFSLMTNWMAGAVVGVVAWIVGIAIEGGFLIFFLRRRFGSIERIPRTLPRRSSEDLPYRAIVRFFLPLALTMALGTSMHPIIQSGMGREISPTTSLAAYGVALGLTGLFSGIALMVHQCALVFTKGETDPNWPIVKQFSVGVGILVSATMVLLAQSPLGSFVVMTLMGVNEPVASIALQTLTAFAIFPVAAAWREAYWGLLMVNRNTSVIGIAKTGNLAAVALAITLAFGPIRALIPLDAAVIGALCFSFGEVFESLIVWRQAVKARLRGQATKTGGMPHSS